MVESSLNNASCINKVNVNEQLIIQFSYNYA